MVGILYPASCFGGVFQYCLTITEALARHTKLFQYAALVGTADVREEVASWGLGCPILDCARAGEGWSDRFVGRSNLIRAIMEEIGIRAGSRASQRASELELVVVPFPSLYAVRLGRPYVVGIPDLMHRYYPSFPEFPFGERLMRNVICRIAARRARLVIVDSVQGKNDVVRYCGVRGDKIRVVPYIPAGYMFAHKGMDGLLSRRILERYELPDKFIFYPAQFWHHKNHVRLLKALRIIRIERRLVIPLVLVGSAKDNYARVMMAIEDLGLGDQVVHLGYVAPLEIAAIYKCAVAVVFPSLFGPTNIPLVEAMLMGTPLIYSDIFAMREQVDGAGIGFNPYDVEDMVEKIVKVWTDGELRRRLTEAGDRRALLLTLESYGRTWEGIIAEALRGSGSCLDVTLLGPCTRQTERAIVRMSAAQ